MSRLSSSFNDVSVKEQLYVAQRTRLRSQCHVSCPVYRPDEMPSSVPDAPN